MVSLRNMEFEDIQRVLEWNDDGQAFLMQWSNFIYPLTREQFVGRIISDDFMVFSIERDRTMVGTIQKRNRNGSFIKIGALCI